MGAKDRFRKAHDRRHQIWATKQLTWEFTNRLVSRWQEVKLCECQTRDQSIMNFGFVTYKLKSSGDPEAVHSAGPNRKAS